MPKIIVPNAVNIAPNTTNVPNTMEMCQMPWHLAQPLCLAWVFGLPVQDGGCKILALPILKFV